jgi:hypothetical protein
MLKMQLDEKDETQSFIFSRAKLSFLLLLLLTPSKFSQVKEKTWLINVLLHFLRCKTFQTGSGVDVTK